MNKSKIFEVTKFSFHKALRNKAFIIMNILTFVSMLCMINAQYLKDLFKYEDEVINYKLNIIDNDNLVYDEFYDKFANNTKDSTNKFEVSKIEKNEYTSGDFPKDYLLVEVNTDTTDIFNITFTSREAIKSTDYNYVVDTLSSIRTEKLKEKYELSSGDYAALTKELQVERKMVSVDSKDSELKNLITIFASALSYLIATFLFSKIAQEISQEKQSKSCEYILTAITEKEYLFAKVFSNVMIILIQGLLFITYFLTSTCISRLLSSEVATGSLTISLSSGISGDIVSYILILVLFNVLNLILLSIIQATLSSKSSSSAEAGNSVTLLVMIMMCLYFTTSIVVDPLQEANIFVKIISALPLFSAYYLPALFLIGQASVVEMVAAVLIQIIAIPVTFKICAPIFKNGLLDYTHIKAKQTPKIAIAQELVHKKQIKDVGFAVGLGILMYVGLQLIFSLIFRLILATPIAANISEENSLMYLEFFAQIVSLVPSAMLVNAYSIEKKKKAINKSISDETISSDIRRNETPSNNKQKKFKPYIVIVGFAIAMFIQILMSLVLYPILGIESSATDELLAKFTPASPLFTKILLLVTVAVVPGILEEMFFRRALINVSKHLGKIFAIVFSAFLFGFIHMNLSQGIFAFTLGLVFGTIYLYTNDIRYTIVIHTLNNLIGGFECILTEDQQIILLGIVLLLVLIGIILFIIKTVKGKLKNLVKNVFLAKDEKALHFKTYFYLFSDYVFDIAMIFVLALGMLTEKLL